MGLTNKSKSVVWLMSVNTGIYIWQIRLRNDHLTFREEGRERKVAMFFFYISVAIFIEKINWPEKCKEKKKKYADFKM